MSNDERADRLELLRVAAVDPELGDVSDLQAALSNSPELAERHRRVVRFDDRIRAAMPLVSIPVGLQAKMLQAVAVEPIALSVASIAVAKPTRSWKRTILTWSSISLALCIGLVGWRMSHRTPVLTLEVVAADARMLYNEIGNDWTKLSAKSPTPDNWPTELAGRAITGSHDVVFLDQSVTAYRLVKQNREAMVILLPRDCFPAAFEFAINSSGDPVKVIEVSNSAYVAVVLVRDERDFDLFESSPPMIGMTDFRIGGRAA